MLFSFAFALYSLALYVYGIKGLKKICTLIKFNNNYYNSTIPVSGMAGAYEPPEEGKERPTAWNDI